MIICRNDLLEKNRRTRMSIFAAVLILWCFITLFVFYAFVLFLHTKIEKDLVSQTAANMRNIEDIIRDHVQSIIDEEIQKMRNEKWAPHLAVSDEDNQSIQRELVYSSSFKKTHEVTGRSSDNEVNSADDTFNAMKPYRSAAKTAKEKRLLERHSTKLAESTFTAKLTPKSPTTDPKIAEGTHTIHNETLIHNTTSQSRIFKRGAEAYTSSISVSTTNSVRASNQSPKVIYNEHNPDEDGTSIEQNSRLKPTSPKSDAVELADGQIANVHIKSRKNNSRSPRANRVVVLEDECLTVVSREQNASSAPIKLTSEERKICTPSELVEEIRSPEIDGVVAAQLGADSSSFKGQKQYYRQNDLVRHPTGDYREWKFSNWHYDLQMYKYVDLKNGGMVIQRRGLYFVYGQIYFTEFSDINGFVIMKNNVTVLQCVTSFHGDKTRTELSNTCFTGGLVFCKKGDELRIRGAHPGRSVVLETTRSFFGMFKLEEGSQEDF